ncbi:uncharacterized protein LOC120655159 isoform X2 [Panicum virgatum]|uniref:uncharacterized protein LOC120655159 isoform X2 n=1 Tax=Panicum virgatum TaxID=38727 RepID=UPI0019D53705|nr:uncharacterized protein LOC120655159 isoform X2 [Panicum virgatum]
MAGRSFLIRSPKEESDAANLVRKGARTEGRANLGVPGWAGGWGQALGLRGSSWSQRWLFEAVLLGAKNAAIAGSVVAVPTLVGCRVLPWAKANLNYTAQALIISAGFQVVMRLSH